MDPKFFWTFRIALTRFGDNLSLASLSSPTFEFHISRVIREKYGFDEGLYTLTGNVILADPRAARVLAQRMNEQRELKAHPEQTIRASRLHAMSLLDEIFHYVAGLYRRDRNPKAFAKALAHLEQELGAEAVHQTLRAFVEEFPPIDVYQEGALAEEYLGGTTLGIPNAQIVLEELLVLFLANDNPAFEPFLELFDDSSIEGSTSYREVIASLRRFFETQPPFGPYQQYLIDLLKAPVLASPHSLVGQLLYVRQHWGLLLSGELIERLLHRLLVALDMLKEEEKLPSLGPGEALVPSFLKGTEYYDEPERYSPDADWMANVVLIAKNAFVWLDQLSKKYARQITRLDEIPDAELDTLSRWGFTALWLIGVWERSPASQTIKQNTGNPEALASAYSLYDYSIARELGGEVAFERLKKRAIERGIRLAVDMVPNHKGLYSKWVIEHPDRFIQVSEPPFPKYSFSGPDLSYDSRVGLCIEDGYWDRSDAAVVFKRLDRWTGDARYLYHGNDGTAMPWNDTAQLNFLISEVREAVIQEILSVARRSSIIRFDAAMTLTKRHFQRLWFPRPGTGGDIPSRSEHGMSQEEFDHLFPIEFWREVVDRVAQEAPETLLLAEAFWLLEGFFVRTLGMHRVYNSSFMNMLHREENSKYRSVIKNVLEFDREILKRFVNFMSNPDEETAARQFGKGDKYFGIATLMATLPGLPMFGHGQVEGFEERYGMEYRRAYQDEAQDEDLIRRHEGEIFPLLRKRRLFSGVESFLLYDFYRPDGKVNENVFAHSNGSGKERALVVYNNSYEATSGWARVSAAYLDPLEKKLAQRNLLQGLGLESGTYLVFRDHPLGWEYLHRTSDLSERGLYLELGGYHTHVFLDFREVHENEAGEYGRLVDRLQGRPVPSLEEALIELRCEPILEGLRRLINKDTVSEFMNLLTTAPGEGKPDGFRSRLDEAFQGLLLSVEQVAGVRFDIMDTASKMGSLVLAGLKLSRLESRFPSSHSQAFKEACRYLVSRISASAIVDRSFGRILFLWTAAKALSDVQTLGEGNERARSAIHWALGPGMQRVSQDLGCDPSQVEQETHLARVLTECEGLWPTSAKALSSLSRVLERPGVQAYLQCNRHRDVLWFNRERFQDLAWWFLAVSLISAFSTTPKKKVSVREVTDPWRLAKRLLALSEKSGYQAHRLLELTASPARLKGKNRKGRND